MLLAWPALAAAADSTLCTSSEEVYFSCQVANGKVVSLCGGLSETDSTQSWLQYRFGQPQRIELAYPARREGSLMQFTGESRWGAGVRLHTVEFKNHGARYLIENSYSSLTEESFLGVRVTPSHSQQAVDLHCRLNGSITDRFESLAALLDPVPR